MQIRITYTDGKEIIKNIPTQFMELKLIELNNILQDIVSVIPEIYNIDILGVYRKRLNAG